MSEGGGSNKMYLAVFFALMIGTILTVYVALNVDLGRPGNIAVGLLIAAVKASLVALFFMHLKFEGKIVWGVALFPIALFLIMIFAWMPDVAFGGTLQKPFTPPAADHGGHK